MFTWNFAMHYVKNRYVSIFDYVHHNTWPRALCDTWHQFAMHCVIPYTSFAILCILYGFQIVPELHQACQYTVTRFLCYLLIVNSLI